MDLRAAFVKLKMDVKLLIIKNYQFSGITCLIKSFGNYHSHRFTKKPQPIFCQKRPAWGGRFGPIAVLQHGGSHA